MFRREALKRRVGASIVGFGEDVNEPVHPSAWPATPLALRDGFPHTRGRNHRTPGSELPLYVGTQLEVALQVCRMKPATPGLEQPTARCAGRQRPQPQQQRGR